MSTSSSPTLFFMLLAFFLSATSCKKENNSNANLTSGLTDPRDGNVYRTVRIGEQLWMAENLRYLPEVSHPVVGNSTHPYYYVYMYWGVEPYFTYVNEAKETEHYSQYGVLYNWHSAVNSCPPGWHLPTNEEWGQLTDHLGGDSSAAHALRNADLLLWNDPWTGPDSTSTNGSGFSALPGGRRNPAGTFGGLGAYGYWWSSSESADGKAWYLEIQNNDNIARRVHWFGKEIGASVRCIRDQ